MNPIDPVEAMGLLAGAVGSLAYAPQALKILRGGSAKDISVLTYTMISSSASLWAVYGLSRGSVSILMWNIVAASLSGAVLALKLRDLRREARLKRTAAE